jgi:hypothetical protein
MQRSLRLVLMCGLAAVAALAMAIFPSLSNTLIGVPVNGVTPSGEIKVDQSRLPKSPSIVQIKMKNVNLPTGTVLGVTIDSEFYGTVTVVSGQVNGSISTFLQTGRTARISITTSTGSVVAFQTASWKT